MIAQHPFFAKSTLALSSSRRLFCVLALTAFSSAQDRTDLTQLSPEQLSKIEVTSMSKKEQRLSDTAGAVFVITRQDIRNSAATSIPELLRMVPGLQVAQLNGYQWAVSARGFAEQYASKMLASSILSSPASSGANKPCLWKTLKELKSPVDPAEQCGEPMPSME
jgi:outer membrane receptor protein involved in Fe transport